MSRSYLQHGRRHRAGGSDPIGLGGKYGSYYLYPSSSKLTLASLAYQTLDFSSGLLDGDEMFDWSSGAAMLEAGLYSIWGLFGCDDNTVGTDMQIGRYGLQEFGSPSAVAVINLYGIYPPSVGSFAGPAVYESGGMLAPATAGQGFQFQIGNTDSITHNYRDVYLTVAQIAKF